MITNDPFLRPNGSHVIPIVISSNWMNNNDKLESWLFQPDESTCVVQHVVCKYVQQIY